MLKYKYKKPFLIAEVGINHNGSVAIAKKIIDFDEIPEHHTIINKPKRGLWYLEKQLRGLLKELQIIQLEGGADI